MRYILAYTPINEFNWLATAVAKSCIQLQTERPACVAQLHELKEADPRHTNWKREEIRGGT